MDIRQRRKQATRPTNLIRLLYKQTVLTNGLIRLLLLRIQLLLQFETLCAIVFVALFVLGIMRHLNCPGQGFSEFYLF